MLFWYFEFHGRKRQAVGGGSSRRAALRHLRFDRANGCWLDGRRKLYEAQLVIRPACTVSRRQYIHSLAHTPAAKRGAWFFAVIAEEAQKKLIIEAQRLGREIEDRRNVEKAARFRRYLDEGGSSDWLRPIWNKGLTIPHCDPEEWRWDIYGRTLQFEQYGTKLPFGWEIDHVRPAWHGGSHDLDNLQPLHWRSNLEKGTTYRG
jgi:hypothetical protein